MTLPRPSALLPLLLSSSLLLAGCGGGGTPPTRPPVTPPTDGGPVVTPGTFNVDAAVPPRALVSGQTALLEVTVTPQQGFTGPVTAELVNAPAGVSASPVTATVSGPTTLRLTVQTTANAAGLLRLSVRVSGSGVSQTDDAFAFVYRAVNLPQLCADQFCSALVQTSTFAGHTYWVAYGRSGAGAVTVEGTDGRTGERRSVTVALEYNERLTRLVSAQGQLWGATSSSGAPYRRPALVRLSPDTGISEAFPVGSEGQEITDLKALPDGRLVMRLRGTDNRTTQLVVFGPSPKAVIVKDLPPALLYSDLAVAPDGRVWVVPGESSTALRFDPATGELTGFGVGASNGVARLAVTDDGHVWMLFPQMGELRILNPVTATLTAYDGPAAFGFLQAIGDVVAYIPTDSVPPARLLSRSDRGIRASVLPLPDALTAVAVSPEGGIGGLNITGVGQSTPPTATAYILPPN